MYETTGTVLRGILPVLFEKAKDKGVDIILVLYDLNEYLITFDKVL